MSASMPVLYRGDTVFAADGAEIGAVDETRPGHFQVHGAHHGGFWLERGTVASAAAGRVELSFKSDELKAHTVSEPGLAGVIAASSRQRAYLPGATEEEANDLYDPATAVAGRA